MMKISFKVKKEQLLQQFNLILLYFCLQNSVDLMLLTGIRLLKAEI